MIARLFRRLWCVAIAALFAAAALGMHLLGARIGLIASGLVGAAVVLALHPTVIGISFVMSRIAGDPIPPANRLSPWQAVRMFDAEIDASVRGVWFANPFLADRPAPAPMHPTRRWPILFVHGYLCGRGVWHPFMRDAAARGYRCEAVTLPDPFAAIETQVRSVEDAVDALARDGEPVVIVAHSMGGLVARALMRRVASTRVAHVVTLGSPHRGTLSASFATAGSGYDMRVRSEWLQALERDETEGRGLRPDALTSVWSHHDDVVYPQTTARVDGATNLAIAGCGHVSLLYDARVRTIVFDRLASLQRAASAS